MKIIGYSISYFVLRKGKYQVSGKIETLCQGIAEYMTCCEDKVKKPECLGNLRNKIEILQNRERVLVKRQSQLQSRKKELKKDHCANHQINVVDHDARFAPKSQGPSYNFQIAVNSLNNLIVANSIVSAPNDQNQFCII